MVPDFRKHQRRLIVGMAITFPVVLLCVVVASLCWRNGFWFGTVLNIFSAAINLQNIELSVRMLVKLRRLGLR